MTAEKQDSTSKIIRRLEEGAPVERIELLSKKREVEMIMHALNNRLFGDHVNPRIEFERNVNGDGPAYYANFYGGM
jgi:hypothetical protein